MLCSLIPLLGLLRALHRRLNGVNPLRVRKHLPVREHLDDVAFEALHSEDIPPPELVLASGGIDAGTALEESELGLGAHLPEHLSNGESLVEEEVLNMGVGDGDGRGSDANRLAVANEVDLTLLGKRGLDGGGVRAR